MLLENLSNSEKEEYLTSTLSPALQALADLPAQSRKIRHKYSGDAQQVSKCGAWI